jgi:hypothetical protein
MPSYKTLDFFCRYNKTLIFLLLSQINFMAEITISQGDWERLKIKVKRKYRELSEEDLAYTQGEEENLIQRLMTRLKRNREYVVFTLKKGLANIDTNIL